MLEQLLDEALLATRLGNKPKADQLLSQLAEDFLGSLMSVADRTENENEIE